MLHVVVCLRLLLVCALLWFDGWFIALLVFMIRVFDIGLVCG